MKRMASQGSTSVEKTAASASAQASGKRSSSTIGSTASRFPMPGMATRATIPSSTGAKANSMRTAALRAMPVRSARSLRAPQDFWTSPGEMMNAGASSTSNVQPEPGPAEYVGSTKEGGTAGPTNPPNPPAPSRAIGSATANPAIITASWSTFTRAEPAGLRGVK